MIQLDTDYNAAQVMALDSRKGVDVTEYQGSLHVRYYRRVVAVYNPSENSVRVNDLRTAAEKNVVNRVLFLVECPRRLEVLKVNTAPQAPAVKVNPTFIWIVNGASTAFTPRESFSCITGVSLSTAAGRQAHVEALNG